MQPRLGGILFGVVSLLALVRTGFAAPPGRAFVQLELRTGITARDGCTDCGCRAAWAVARNGPSRWWASFGVAKPGGSAGWQAVDSASRCGSGSFDEIRGDFTRLVGTPYLVVDASVKASVPAAGTATVELQLTFRKLSGFDPAGQALYTRSRQQRTIRVAESVSYAVPLLVSDRLEAESFGVDDVVLQLRASVVEREPAVVYGAISVAADMPGAEVLLDGGFVGRIIEGSRLVLDHVPSGPHEIHVRDFSDRKVGARVNVTEGQTLEVTLRLLEPTSPTTGGDLIPVGKNPQGYEEFWRARDGAFVVEVPAGEFLMGSPEGQGEPNERPQHRVHVSTFRIDKTEVTWRQFRKYAQATGVGLPPVPVSGAADDYPVSFVLWDEARRYCEWAGGRLPTEAEWEKAARGRDARVYPWGDSWDPDRCNTIAGGMHRPESAGAYRSCLSPYGVLDLSGSMWEWTSDWYGEAWYAESPPSDPPGPASGTLRVKRGGAWMSQAGWVRAAYRAPAAPTSRNVDHGFRCAHGAPD